MALNWGAKQKCFVNYNHKTLFQVIDRNSLLLCYTPPAKMCRPGQLSPLNTPLVKRYISNPFSKFTVPKILSHGAQAPGPINTSLSVVSKETSIVRVRIRSIYKGPERSLSSSGGLCFIFFFVCRRKSHWTPVAGHGQQ